MPAAMGGASFIPPVTRRADGKWGGKWRSQMNEKHLKNKVTAQMGGGKFL
jgi:hypothetical protein